MGVYSNIDLGECRRRVTIDLEREMGITDLLEAQPDRGALDLIEKARQALEPVIELQAWELYQWYHK